MIKFRYIFIVIVLLSLAIQIGLLFSEDDFNSNDVSKDYYIENGYLETSSKNLVTGIYLYYRLFDSFFEASILLVVVTGIAFMAVKDEDLL